MTDYIRRNDALEIIKRTCGDYATAWSEIRKLPTADVAPVVHGRWIGSSGIFQGKCSVCGYMTYDKTADWARNYWPHCPNCGAKMDKQNEPEN